MKNLKKKTSHELFMVVLKWVKAIKNEQYSSTNRQRSVWLLRTDKCSDKKTNATKKTPQTLEKLTQALAKESHGSVKVIQTVRRY